MAGRRDEDEDRDKRVINQLLITGHKQGEIISGRQHCGELQNRSFY